MVIRLNEWLSLTKEEPLEPALPICDPHHHLWDYPDSVPESRIPGFVEPIRHYLLEHLLEDISGGHNIVRTVFVQCESMYRKDGPEELRPVGETEFVQGIAAQSWSGQYGKAAVAAGIVGFADLRLGSNVARVLEAHIAASRSRFRGIRFVTASDIVSRIDTTDLLSTVEFREGFAQLRKYNLSYDAWLPFYQLPGLVELARAFPDTTIVLNHVGGPLGVGLFANKREEVFREWKKSIDELSKCPNVVVKLGGLGMPICGFGWNERATPLGSIELAEEMEPYYYRCIDCFGVSRCMFESNFPVDKSSYSYTVLWNAFKRIAGDFSAGEKASLFHDTAVRVYRLSDKR